MYINMWVSWSYTTVYACCYVDIISTIQILSAQRHRHTQHSTTTTSTISSNNTVVVPAYTQLSSDFTWIVGAADSLTTMQRCLFQDLTTGTFQRIVYPGMHSLALYSTLYIEYIYIDYIDSLLIIY